MDKDDKKRNSKNDEVPEKDADFSSDSLLSFIEVQGDDKTRKAPPEERRKRRPIEPSPPDERYHPGGVKVDDVLAGKRPLEIDIPLAQDLPPAPEAVSHDLRPLELTPPAAEEGALKVSGTEQAEVDTRARTEKLQPVESPSEGRMGVDQEYLSKLDLQLKDELVRLKNSNQQGMIPGRFLEARKTLTQEGTLECPQCKIKVTDTPGKIDYCPQCGLALDDYLHQYRREWENKYKNRTSEGVKEFGPPKQVSGKTGWERWKEDKGIDPEAELLECPQCGMQVYDDPFIANKCPKCHIPLDLHLQFPQPYIGEREAKHQHRVGMDDELEEKIKKLTEE